MRGQRMGAHRRQGVKASSKRQTSLAAASGQRQDEEQDQTGAGEADRHLRQHRDRIGGGRRGHFAGLRHGRTMQKRRQEPQGDAAAAEED